MKGVAWDGVGAPQLESAKKAGELISDVSRSGDGSYAHRLPLHCLWHLCLSVIIYVPLKLHRPLEGSVGSFLLRCSFWCRVSFG